MCLHIAVEQEVRRATAVGFMDWALWIRLYGLGFMDQGLGLRFYGLGFMD